MSLILKMQINDQSENKYVFSTENGEIELIPLSVIENGTYTPEENQAYNRVTVNVPQTVLEHLDITTNGTYEASSGHAYDVVTVNVKPILDILNETISSNGSYVFNPSQDYDAFESVQLTVSVPDPVFEHLTQTITSNGTYNYTPAGKDGFDEVDITVNVPAVTPNLQTKNVTITQNGNSVVTPDSGYDGLDEVDINVNVQGGGGGSSDVITGTVTITDTNGYGECWVPMTIPAGKAIGAILVRSRTSIINTGPSSWHHSIILWGSVPSMTGDANTKYKQRYSAYLNNATATSYTSEVTKSQSQLSQYLSTTMGGVVAYNADFGLGFKVKKEKDNKYGFAVNTDYSYVVVLVDSE